MKFTENQKAKLEDAQSWWIKRFDQKDRTMVESQFRPMGSITAESMAISDDPKTVGTLASHLKKVDCRELGYRLFDRADKLVSDKISVVSRHFYFALRGDFYYRWRDLDQGSIEEAIDSYRRQIALSSIAVSHLQMVIDGENFIPGHAGYRQLRIIEEKRQNYTLAKKLCVEARAEGWTDHWDKHIARLDKKIAKEIAVTSAFTC